MVFIGFLYIDEALNKTLKLLESSFSFIKIEKNFEKKIQFYGFETQFYQAILNILCNTKDIFIERKIENPCMKISVFKKILLLKFTIMQKVLLYHQ